MKPFYYLSDFPERKNAGQNFVAECPKCGKKHLSISKKTGAFHCFYAGCDFNGKLKDFWEERPYSDSSLPATPAETIQGQAKLLTTPVKGMMLHVATAQQSAEKAHRKYP